MVDRAEEIEAREGHHKAQEFARVAFGELTPILSLLEPYLKEKDMRERSKGDARRAVAAYIEWAGPNNAPMSIEGIDRKVAGRFVSDRLLAQMEKKTAQKYLSFLSGYWTWLEVKGYAKDVPWTRQLQRVGKQRRSANLLGDGPSPTGGKRAYTEEEAKLVLNYSPTTSVEQRSIDLARIAALSGIRLDEICRLTVADCAGGWFNVNSKAGDGKTLASTRRIPIHSALAPLIAKRTKGKAADDYLIHDLTEPKEGRERSMPASKAYGKLREKLGVGGKTYLDTPPHLIHAREWHFCAGSYGSGYSYSRIGSCLSATRSPRISITRNCCSRMLNIASDASPLSFVTRNLEAPLSISLTISRAQSRTT